jgi:murein DD-endopeptidase MepM/ murein hydrolase activator NlpD
VASVSRIFGERLFPERQLLLKSSGGVRHIALPGWLQATVLAACIASVGGVVFLTIGFARLHATVDHQIEAARSPAPAAGSPDSQSLDQLRAEMEQMPHDLSAATQNYADANTRYQQTRDKLSTLTADNDKLRTELSTLTQRAKTLQQARDEAEHHAKQAEQALNSKASNLSQLAKNLDENKSELRHSETQRTALQNRVQQLQMELQAANSRSKQQGATADAKDTSQKQVATEPTRSAPSQNASPTAAAEDAEPDVVAPMPQRNAGTPHARAGSSELERLLASTGLDIDRLVGSLNAPAAEGQGGPYIALNGPRAAELEKSRQEQLKRLAKVLPLRSPLDEYQLRSDFGPRIDPINHRASFHPGLDLAAPYKSHVYSTGPGTVIFTGTREGYGRMVEIDHGHGIVTRYAHLHRILVARGQKVAAHTVIGELGSTGRSTGPHVHYEVDVDGTPLDPAKFMEAGKNVVQISGK